MTGKTKDKGDQLEKRVERLFKKLGKWNVQRNLVLKDKFGNISQIDVAYGFLFKTYIECKNYSGSVPLEDVAKFKEVLSLNNIPHYKGLFITTSTYVPRATTIGIRTVDGKQLRSLERRANLSQLLRISYRFAIAGSVALLAFEIFSDPKKQDTRYWEKAFYSEKKRFVGEFEKIKAYISDLWK